MARAYSVQQVIDALRATRGMVYLAADHLGCSPQTIYNFLARHPSVREARERESGRLLDYGEIKLYEQVMQGEAWAVKYLLSTKGKERGYTDKLEVEQHHQGDLTLHLEPARERLRRKLADTAARQEDSNGHRPGDQPA